MEKPTMYSRTYSKCSARQLVSGKGARGPPLSRRDLLVEFRNHADKTSQRGTALVSVSNRIIDTIAFIEAEATANIHHAQQLAMDCNLPGPGKFHYEFLFEWAIPEKYVVHQVSLRTLMDRGLWKNELQYLALKPTTAELRYHIASIMGPLKPFNGGWKIGIYVGYFARKFGARAPVDWIAHQLFRDCVQTKVINEDTGRLNFAHGESNTVDLQFFCDLDEGINTVLVEWWLADVDFHVDLKLFEEWQCFEGSYDNETNDTLLAKHVKIREAIEAGAIEIGL
ncbi:hypothetical protein B0I35DRAFT_469389 [Stachybotrys elegans]|uniref:Uncharacterized protein n=1 Tax=Stachybotrys elegans TaxID=80388 RepID=A0A8K0SQ96_9HYPO|nr:hypothetical protein B0I35DRAFT_469389 [Stachybotrys elegans]